MQVTIKELRDLLTKTMKEKNCKDCNAEFWLGEKQLELESIGQFGLIPDIVFHFEKEEDE